MANIIVDIEGNKAQQLHTQYPFYDIDTKVWLIGTYNLESMEYIGFFCPLVGDRATSKINHQCLDRLLDGHDERLDSTRYVCQTAVDSFYYIKNTIRSAFVPYNVRIKGFWNEVEMYSAYAEYTKYSTVYYSGFNCVHNGVVNQNNYDEDIIKFNFGRYDIDNYSTYINLSRFFKKPEPQHHHGMRWDNKFKANEEFILASMAKNIDDCLDISGYPGRLCILAN